MNWKKIGWGILVINILILDIGLAYSIWQIASGKWLMANSTKINITPSNPPLSLSGGSDVNEKLSALDYRLASLEAGSSATPIPTVPIDQSKSMSKTAIPTKAKTRTVSYYTIPGAGTTASMVWDNLRGTDFYFDTKDYPGLVEVYFETNINLYNGNGKAFVRLYDATHGIGVQGSDVETVLQPATLVTSGRVSFWAGKNLIRVQAKTLTADTTVYNSGRLKIVSEN